MANGCNRSGPPRTRWVSSLKAQGRPSFILADTTGNRTTPLVVQLMRRTGLLSFSCLTASHGSSHTMASVQEPTLKRQRHLKMNSVGLASKFVHALPSTSSLASALGLSCASHARSDYPLRSIAPVSGFAIGSALFATRPLDELQSLQAGMPVLADDDVVMHGDAERGRDVDDRAGHLDVGLRWRRIATRMVVHQEDGGGG
jgi:hypothetical protein